MATLERIRKRSGLLIVIIGLAMLAFILTDLLGNRNSIFRANANVVGKVNGKTIEAREFSNKMTELQQRIKQQNPQQAQFMTNKQVADGVWNEFLRDELLNEQYDDLGITVTSEELYNRLKADPNIQQAQVFKDQSGKFSEGLFQQYLNNIRENKDLDEKAADAYAQWLDFEKGQKTFALQTKYNTAIQKGIYVPTAVASAIYKRNNSTTDAQFVVMEYATVSDSAVKITDSDLRDYYNDHKEEFKAEPSASIEYVNFPIEASEQDRSDIKNELNGYINDTNSVAQGDTAETFRNTKEDSLYAFNRADSRVVPDYYKKDNLPAGLDSTLFEKPKGYIYGPYEANNSFRVTKIVDKKNLPDSVKARHILISFAGIQNGNPDRTGQQAKAMADSLLKVIKEDTSKFGQIARQLSDDPGSAAKGGKLGWFGDRAMVKPFANYAFRHNKGDVGLVISQFGFHIIQIMDQKGSQPALKLVTIDRDIEPSDKTMDDIYNKASAFASGINSVDEFSAKAEKMQYKPKAVTDLKHFDENIVGLGNNRDIVKWANGIGSDNEDSEVGDVQLFNNGNSSYVVVVLTARDEEDYKSLASVKEQITPKVIQHKKAQQFIDKFKEAMGGTQDVKALAQKLSLNTNNQSTSFQSSMLNGFGNEPKVIGEISGLAVGKMSQPIEGNRGVYVVQVLNRDEAQDLPGYASHQKEQEQAVRGRVSGQVFLSLKDAANIEDKRAKFY